MHGELIISGPEYGKPDEHITLTEDELEAMCELIRAGYQSMLPNTYDWFKQLPFGLQKYCQTYR